MSFGMFFLRTYFDCEVMILFGAFVVLEYGVDLGDYLLSLFFL